MISAWNVYLVMQLDSIVVAAFGMAVILGIAAIICTIVAAIAGAEGEPLAPRMARATKSVSAAFFVAVLASALLPSTKTAAAMIVLPAMANNETLKREADDLYGLAKQALKEAIDAPEPVEP